MIIVRLLSPERSWLVGSHQSLLGYRSRHCHGINYTQNPPIGYQYVSDRWSLASPVRKVEFKSHSAAQSAHRTARATSAPTSRPHPTFPASIGPAKHGSALVCLTNVRLLNGRKTGRS